MAWPLRDIFLSYVALLKDSAKEQYRADLLVWSNLAPYQKERTKPPSIPSILK